MEQAARAVEWANTRTPDEFNDIYVCMSAQAHAEDKISSKSGRPYKAALRRMENAVALKSLYIDVDVKPADLDKGYASSLEAVQEFTRIRKELGLPAPTFVIKSGSGGFHAHWTFAEPIPADRWFKLSYAFSAGLRAKGFRGDNQCVVDVVRLLRVPGTNNHKGGGRTPVTLLGNPGQDYFVETLEQALAPFATSTPTVRLTPRQVVLGPPSSVFKGVVLPPLEAGLDLNQPTIDEVAQGCPFVAQALAEGGTSNPNPLWLQTANISLFTKGQRADLHRMSCGYTTYSVAETDALYDRQLDTKVRKDMGYPRCKTIASYGAATCATCPNFLKDQSPLNFAVRALPPQVNVPNTIGLMQTPVVGAMTGGQTTAVSGVVLAPLPSAYSYDAQQFVCLVETDPVTQAQSYNPVCRYIFEQPWLQQEPPVLNFTTHIHAGTRRPVRVPYEFVTDKSGLSKTLARQGMLVHFHETKLVGDFMVSWVEKMRATASNVVQSQPFGWTVHAGKVAGFVYAGHVWSTDMPRPAAVPDPALAGQYNPSGELQPWLNAARMITDQRRPALDAILAAAFAAPLVRFTGQTGLLMSTYSRESGIGKSTALKVAQAVWGHPLKAVQTLNDTQNSVLKKMGDTKSLPLFWDELKTVEDTTRFVNLAFQLSQGKEKSRLSADTSYREPGTWQTLLCSTSNASIMHHILQGTKTTSAGIYRVFEFAVPRGSFGQISPVTAQMLTAELNDNYGYAGVAYAQFLGANHARVAAEISQMATALERRLDVRADERFWLALITVVIMGARYANELQLTTIDVSALTKFMVGVLGEMRQERAVATVDLEVNLNVLNYLARYLNENNRYYTLRSTTIWRANTRAPLPVTTNPSAVMLTPGADLNLRELRVQIGKDDHWCRLAKAPFEAWLSEQQVSPPTILKALINQFGVKEMRGRLGAGTALVTAQEPVLDFYYADPKFEGLIEQ